jgi:hypothetical protein
MALINPFVMFFERRGRLSGEQIGRLESAP